VRAQLLGLLCIVCLLPACSKNKHKKQKPSILNEQVDTSFALLSAEDIIRNQHHEDNQEKVITHITDVEQIQQYEAKRSDIPIPLHAKPLQLSYLQNDDIMSNVTLEYHIGMKSHDLMLFYEHEMERLGWHHGNVFGNVYRVYTFKKPNRSCALFIEPLSNTKKTRLVICLNE